MEQHQSQYFDKKKVNRLESYLQLNSELEKLHKTNQDGKTSEVKLFEKSNTLAEFQIKIRNVVVAIKDKAKETMVRLKNGIMLKQEEEIRANFEDADFLNFMRVDINTEKIMYHLIENDLAEVAKDLIFNKQFEFNYNYIIEILTDLLHDKKENKFLDESQLNSLRNVILTGLFKKEFSFFILSSFAFLELEDLYKFYFNKRISRDW